MILPEIKWKLDLMSHALNVPHAEISRKLGLTAARTWTLEDCVYLPDEQRHSGWDYYVERSGVKSIEEVFAALRTELTPVLEPLKHLIERYDLDVQFVCVIKAIEGDGPEVILEADSMKFIADLNARLCFDLYYYEAPNDDDF